MMLRKYLFSKSYFIRLCVACWSVVCCVGMANLAHAQVKWQRIELGAAGARYPFAVYGNKPLHGDLKTVRRAVLVFHGMGRNGAGYFAAAHASLRASGMEDETLLLAPNYFVAEDGARHDISGLPLWRDSRWNRGEDAANWPRALSAFEPIDDLLMLFTDRAKFPALQSVVLAGHSAGGQLVHRYSVLNGVDEKLRAVGVQPRYIVANPSSFLYFTNERPVASSAAFALYDEKLCPGYNDYRYGLQKLPPYATDAPPAPQMLFRRYAAREVAVLLGTADIDPDHVQLDKSCGAQAGGSNRLERGRNYIRHERHLANTSLVLNRQVFEVIGVAHSQARMFGSKCGARLLFGLAEQANTTGAACRALP